RDEILAAQFGFYLTKVLEQVFGAAWKVSTSSGLVAKPAQYVFTHAFESEPVANANRVNDDPRSPRAIDCFVELSAARVIHSIREQDDCPACYLLIRAAPSKLIPRQNFIRRYVYRVVERGGLVTRASRAKTPRVLNLIECAVQSIGSRRESLDQLDVVLKSEYCGKVFARPDDRAKELSRGDFLLRERVFLAARQIHQNCNVDRQGSF